MGNGTGSGLGFQGVGAGIQLRSKGLHFRFLSLISVCWLSEHNRQTLLLGPSSSKLHTAGPEPGKSPATVGTACYGMILSSAHGGYEKLSIILREGPTNSSRTH